MGERSDKGNLLKMIQEKLDEKEELIRAQQEQINELSEKLAAYEGGASPSGEDTERDAVIHEQMEQLIELQERNDQLEAQLASMNGKMREFDDLQQQLKSLLGEG